VREDSRQNEDNLVRDRKRGPRQGEMRAGRRMERTGEYCKTARCSGCSALEFHIPGYRISATIGSAASPVLVT
jgi:hypothetical protein